MARQMLDRATLEKYKQWLQTEERAAATVQKYMGDLEAFICALQGQEVSKESIIHYKEALLSQCAAASVNVKLAAINGLLAYLGWHECRVQPVKIQRSAYCNPQKELTKREYYRLLEAAKSRRDSRLYHLIQTICTTGIRVSEVKFITVEAVRAGQAEVQNKGKTRTVFLSKSLCQRLTVYCRERGLTNGSVFVTRTGRPLHRVNIWAMMKSLCKEARVSAEKVFPHNLRHLFAALFYKQERDLEHLACLLGHSNINTTRIYTRTSGAEHRRQIERMRLVM